MAAEEVHHSEGLEPFGLLPRVESVLQHHVR